MITIAIADDHRQVREIWHFILSSNAAFRVVAACADGQEAIEAAAIHTPDVFIMDINMQPLDGIAATAAITKKHPNIKIIGMSMHTDAIFVKRMLQAGASGYVTKSAPYEELFEAIQQVNAGRYYLCNEIQDQTSGLLVSQR